MAEEQTNTQQETKEKKKSCPAGAPMWMVTFSDMVTLLLTFFVLLLSMANLDPVKFTAASSSIRESFGTQPVPARIEFTLPIFPTAPVTSFTPIQQEMTTKIHERLKAQLELKKMDDKVSVIQQDSDTIILRVNESLLFKSGQSQIPPTSYPLLRNIADIIRPLPMKLLVEGHTDDRQISQNPIGNWDLSMARAVSVTRFFKQGDLLDLDRMSAIGYGPDRPLVPNLDDVSRAKNRRVDFVLRLDRLPDDGKKEPRSNNNVPL